jgi:hypothetical protein
MRSAFLRLLVLGLLATPFSAMASSFTDYPLNFGSAFPFEHGDGPCASFISPSVCVEALIGGQISGNAIGTSPISISQTTAFTFDISPDWFISNLHLLGGTLDYGVAGENGPNPTPFSDWGYEFASKLTLCSSDGVCYSSTSAPVKQGGTTFPTVSFTAQAGPGTGVYETFLYLDNVQVGSDSQPQVNIFLSPVPEPGTFALVFTGVAGLFGAARRRVSKR